jgi:hypothetical protein
MTTSLAKTQLNTVLSALDGKPRNPNTKAAALKAIGRHAEAFGISIDDILSASSGLLDGRQSPKHFVAEISDPATAKTEAADNEPAAPKSREGTCPKGVRSTKQAAMIAMLRRPEGATVEQIAEMTGWQNHTIRGAIAGALKKKLGLTITTERVRSVGPNKQGAPGSYTVYRVIDAA